jgi:hypothetical protein
MSIFVWRTDTLLDEGADESIVMVGLLEWETGTVTLIGDCGDGENVREDVKREDVKRDSRVNRSSQGKSHKSHGGGRAKRRPVSLHVFTPSRFTFHVITS